ncbi:AMP-dependent synthetase and ligase family protein [Actinidia rufa]|uniref:AMP-dependent synthetase and ligase family protein n=1 Tax=Actinidia rufa TaxID=165716 RepID=A0A7J0GI77_9ERIC|nr:AMP-dependent synthetase and ligase family protein [Actinidia rufa]
MCSVEVESILYENPTVNEAAVVARPDEFLGKTVFAFVRAKGGVEERPTEEIVEFCRRRLPNYMVPKPVVFMEELPRNSTCKIEKFTLRDVAKSMGSLPPKHEHVAKAT